MLDRCFSAPIVYNDKRSCLKDNINFSIFGNKDAISTCVTDPGSSVLLSVEQSNKTGAAAGLITVSSHLELPSVLICFDLDTNVKSLDEVRSLEVDLFLYKLQMTLSCFNSLLHC